MNNISVIFLGLINIFSDLKPIFLSEFLLFDQNSAKSAKKLFGFIKYDYHLYNFFYNNLFHNIP